MDRREMLKLSVLAGGAALQSGEAKPATAAIAIRAMNIIAAEMTAESFGVSLW